MAWVSDLLFYLGSLIIFVSTLSIIFTKNLIHSCIYLLATLLGVAALYFSLGADFVGAIQIVVYVGGMVILMLFAIMLTGGPGQLDKTNQVDRFGLLMPHSMGTCRTFFWGILTATVFLLCAGSFIGRSFYLQGAQDFSTFPDLTSTVTQLGRMLITDHVLAFEMVSILLLGALVGAAIIARPKKSSNL